MESAARFAALFQGYSKAHGVFRIKSRDERGKMIGRATTVAGPADFESHLEGKQGVGVIPLRDDNTLLWAAIDVDKYNLPIEDMADRVEKLRLPLLCCASKSGGTHLYVFMRLPQDADPWRKTLDHWASRLGVGGSEVFPKQSYRATPEDIGNWINLPYFGSTERRCWRNGRWLSVEEFLAAAEEVAVGDAVPEPQSAGPVPEELEGAPPCLGMFATTGGVPDGHKHNSLFTLIVYCRKRWPDSWKDAVARLNPLVFNPALTHDDLERNFKSMSRKEYEFQCQGPFCNKAACRSAEYGRGEVAGSGTSCEIGGVTKIVGDPVYWIVEIDGVRVKCQTAQLYNQNRFNQLAMDTVTRCPAAMPMPRWLKYVDDKIKVADIVESPEDASPKGIFKMLLEQFLGHLNRRARDLDEILVGKPYLDADGMFLVRGPDLLEYLEERRFRYESQHRVWLWLRDLGASHGVRRVGERTVKVWMIPASLAGDSGSTIGASQERHNDITPLRDSPPGGAGPDPY